MERSSTEDRRSGMRDAFRKFDDDGSGTIDAGELVAILTRETGSGTAMSLEEAKALIAEFDTNGDGRLDIEEYMNAMVMGNMQKSRAVDDETSLKQKVEAICVALGIDAEETMAATVAKAEQQMELESDGGALLGRVDKLYDMLIDDG